MDDDTGLPVADTAMATLRELGQKWPELVKALILPAAVLTAVEIVSFRYEQSAANIALTWLIGIPFYVLFAVVCHRTIILGSSSLRSSIGLFWSERELRFLGWIVILTILSWLWVLVAGVIALIIPGRILGIPLSVVALLLLSAYLFARLSMVYPATATDNRTSIKDAWYLTYNNGIRICLTIALTASPFLLLSVGMSFAFSTYPSVFSQVMHSLVWHCVTAVTICTVSVIYARLAGVGDDEDAFAAPTS